MISATAAHAAVGVDMTQFVTNPVEEERQLAFDIDFSAPVARHSVARNDAEALEGEAAGETPPARSLEELVAHYQATSTDSAAQDCLAGAVYFESKGEPLAGQLAVAEVVLNRVASRRYPSSVCGVVTQRHQFSFVRGGRIPAIPRGTRAWKRAVAIARIAEQRLAEEVGETALFFHANYVKPRWSRKRTRIRAIGNHIFYA
ncbi:MAG: cell wall hydrolase [Sphingomonadaceae bacterium]